MCKIVLNDKINIKKNNNSLDNCLFHAVCHNDKKYLGVLKIVVSCKGAKGFNNTHALVEVSYIYH